MGLMSWRSSNSRKRADTVRILHDERGIFVHLPSGMKARPKGRSTFHLGDVVTVVSTSDLRSTGLRAGSVLEHWIYD